MRLDPHTVRAAWSIEAPTPGVVLIDVTLGESRPTTPLHWRMGTWTKPPLDLSLDDGGRPVALQFVLQDERVAAGQSLADLPEPEGGVPIFDINDWPPERYCDETGPVRANRLPSGELRLQIGEPQPVRRACRTAPGLLLGFDERDVLAEIRLGPLAGEDWEAINAFSFVE